MMSKSPYLSEIVGVWHALKNSTYAGWILLCVLALIIAVAIAYKDGSREHRAQQNAALERLRR
jgi:hypothetical protein